MTIERNCFRCGSNFTTFDRRAYICSGCRKPRAYASPVFDPEAPLSPRELQVIDMVVRAMENKEIAYELRLSYGTIKEYMHRIYRKVGVRNRVALVTWALTKNGVNNASITQ